jgi:hypothetical protein
MADIHTYIVVERATIGSGNWVALRALFEAMGTHDSAFPAHNNHKRTRLDGEAVIYESAFDPAEVSLAAFKELLADEFGVDVEDIEHNTSAEDYAGYGTTVWEFLYNAVVRFTVRRFGGGGTWAESRAEVLGYLALNGEAWESDEV